MKTWVGDMTRLFGREGAICITTNGFVKKNGQCVMGKGIAKTIATRWPAHQSTLGTLITLHGNIVQPIFPYLKTVFVSFPVKPVSVISTGKNCVSHMHFTPGTIIPGWAAKADKHIITTSFHRLITLTDQYNWPAVALPLPGCGAGELSWKNDVEPIVTELHLDDRFIFCSFKAEDFNK